MSSPNDSPFEQAADLWVRREHERMLRLDLWDLDHQSGTTHTGYPPPSAEPRGEL